MRSIRSFRMHRRITPTVFQSIFPRQGMLLTNRPCALTKSSTAQSALWTLLNTPTRFLQPSLSKDLARVTIITSAPYTPPLLINCRIFITRQRLSEEEILQTVASRLIATSEPAPQTVVHTVSQQLPDTLLDKVRRTKGKEPGAFCC